MGRIGGEGGGGGGESLTAVMSPRLGAQSCSRPLDELVTLTAPHSVCVCSYDETFTASDSRLALPSPAVASPANVTGVTRGAVSVATPARHGPARHGPALVVATAGKHPR